MHSGWRGRRPNLPLPHTPGVFTFTFTFTKLVLRLSTSRTRFLCSAPPTSNRFGPSSCTAYGPNSTSSRRHATLQPPRMRSVASTRRSWTQLALRLDSGWPILTLCGYGALRSQRGSTGAGSAVSLTLHPRPSRAPFVESRPCWWTTNVAGSLQSGFLEAQLSSLFGVGSFDEGWEALRFDGLLRGGSSLGIEFTNCWQALVAEVTAVREGRRPTEGALSMPLRAAGTEGSKVLLKPQKTLTYELELAHFDGLDSVFKRLPPGDVGRVAWLSLDRFSTQWVTALPSPTLGWVLGNDVFSEVAATYLALPSPACAPLVGQRIGRYQDQLDPLGTKLMTLCLPGDGWRTRHDALKHLLFQDIRRMGAPCTCEVFGLFAPLLPQRGRDETASYPHRKRQGMVPDFKLTTPEGFDSLMELKVVGLAPTWYGRDRLARCGAVAARTREIQSEYIQKARDLDSRFSTAVPASPGPVELKLASFGRIRGLTFGAFGEASDDVHDLVSLLAAGQASRDWASMRCRDSNEAKALIARTLYRSWGLMAVRSQARLKLCGLAHVGTGMQAAALRRDRADLLHARLREAYQLHFCGAAGRRRF